MPKRMSVPGCELLVLTLPEIGLLLLECSASVVAVTTSAAGEKLERDAEPALLGTEGATRRCLLRGLANPADWQQGPRRETGTRSRSPPVTLRSPAPLSLPRGTSEASPPVLTHWPGRLRSRTSTWPRPPPPAVLPTPVVADGQTGRRLEARHLRLHRCSLQQLLDENRYGRVASLYLG